MEHCILSLLPGGDDVEILIVDDGSKDRTAEIADEYERKYPGIVRADVYKRQVYGRKRKLRGFKSGSRKINQGIRWKEKRLSLIHI